ncbi:hypothetical protein HYU94_03750 [Candidatus Daviesbacteria bacterium]|nr:hypothetical protein [Candidatus Daviesbacteria bacterium]
MDAEEYRKKLELDILKIIEEKLISGEMDIARAQAIARMVLQKLHPPLTLEQIYQIAPTLDDHFAELAQAVLPVIKDHREEAEKIVEAHAVKLINSGKFNEASSVMKQITK